MDFADGEDDDAIIKKSVENLVQVCDLVEKFQDEPENEMVQYINKCIEINGEISYPRLLLLKKMAKEK